MTACLPAFYPMPNSTLPLPPAIVELVCPLFAGDRITPSPVHLLRHCASFGQPDLTQ